MSQLTGIDYQLWYKIDRIDTNHRPSPNKSCITLPLQLLDSIHNYICSWFIPWKQVNSHNTAHIHYQDVDLSASFAVDGLQCY